ncbi:hypothetical protein CW751_13445 [Brumimicrobium salinarum]|uniref:Magnesium citrate secondary transporter n=1 Tax=Brumimicrobium salinarum TaxID=2058658 RepID=A0A2I0QZG1_9FLAO|nr:hypothetical protein [Brumimicrobium salinarum]PKR79724.1 hypothetical protein CW751_13445 [Brumimicrobium salinarum]
MKKTISHPLFIVLFLIYITYYGLKQTEVVFPLFVSSYLADLLSIFLVNTFALAIIRKVQNKPNLEFPPLLVLLSIAMFSLFFEFYLPSQSTIYVQDPWDILCYFISGGMYVLWRR